MSGVRRVFVEKKKPFAVNAKELHDEITGYLGIKDITDVRVLIRYDIENLSDDTYNKALTTVFSEPPVDDVYETEFAAADDDYVFSVEYLPGQFDQRADSAEQCVKFLNENETPVIKTATTYIISGKLTEEDKDKIKNHCINPVDSRVADENIPQTLVTKFDTPADVIIFDGFKDMDEDKLKALYDSLGLAMTFKDFQFIKDYFKNEEKRDPSMTEIRVLDTYWSDHCRHTTFATELKDVKGEITFDNVSFKYKDGSDEVLSGINLNVRPGEYVALVGPSGVGKTTLCSLIPRFYEATGGSIRIDGTDIKDVTLKSLRDHIGVVQQDVYLFMGSIKENIRYGRPDATDEEVIAAAKLANAHEFIESFENGYDTDIGQRGVKLSGGQKQRLSIARVFLKNPPILIFDEATSALDNESEQIVQESLEKLAKNRTTLVIAHRLTTIENAEEILMLTEEGIKERGTHKELMKLDGEYAHMVKIHQK